MLTMPMKRKILKYTKFAACLALTPLSSIAQPDGTVVEGIVAVVGSEIVLKSEIEIQFEAISGQNPGSVTHCDVLEDLLFERLMLHHAAIDSVVVDEGEVESNIDRRLDQIAAQMGGMDRLTDYYKKSVPEIKEEMRSLMKNQMTAQRMQARITEGIEITPTEVQTFYNGVPEDSLPLINTEVELAQLVIYPEVDEEAEQEVVDRLETIRERIEGGTSFSTMAVLYSEDPGSNKNGGEYKSIKRGQFVKEFEAVAFNLQPGEVSAPFRTVYGWHIVQLQTKRGEELDLRHILIKPKISDANMNEAKAILDSIRSKIVSGEISFVDAVREFSKDEETRFNNGMMMNPNTGDTKWDLSNLDRTSFYAIEGLVEGDISKPSLWRDEEQKEAFRLVKVVSLIEPHKANMRDDYTRLKEIALQGKRAEAMKEWIEDKIDETFVRLNNNYYNCTFRHNWGNDGAASTNQ